LNHFGVARETVALAERGVISGADVIHCVDHMSTLVIFQNEELINTLATLRLAPLAQLRAGQRDRYADTLLTWLQTGGDASEVAAQLHVHPQTVRYRIRQLQMLFGDRLRDPDVRLELEMAGRAVIGAA
jgi:DNA-binding PucR family transcriptional regulator